MDKMSRVNAEEGIKLHSSPLYPKINAFESNAFWDYYNLLIENFPTMYNIAKKGWETDENLTSANRTGP